MILVFLTENPVAMKINNWQKRWQAALQEQHRQMFDYDMRALKECFAQHVNCPVCSTDSRKAKLTFHKDMFRYYRCPTCLLVYMNPRLNNEATAAFYNSLVNAIYNESKFDAVSDNNLDDRINAENVQILDAVRKTGSKGKILEIGCAKGHFLSQAKGSGYQVWGLELNQKNCAYAADILGPTIINKGLLDARFNGGMFDVVYMRDVIEHLPNPREIMQEINRILKPGGMVFIETHNIDSLINSAVREKHTVIFGFEHPVHWSPRSLAYLLRNSGFEVTDTCFRSMDFTVACLLSYFIEPTFTTILPWRKPPFVKLILKIVRKPFNLYPLKWVDEKFTPQIANKLKRGSTMKVFAKKVKSIPCPVKGGVNA